MLVRMGQEKPKNSVSDRIYVKREQTKALLISFYEELFIIYN